MPKRNWVILLFFCVANVIFSFNVAALTAVIPAISRSLNLSANDAATIIPFYMIPYGVCALVFAPLASRFSIKKLMTVACVLFVLGNCLSLYLDSLPIILFGRVVAGMGASAVMPLALITIGKIFPKDIRGRVLGMFFGCSFFGAMLGLILSAFAPWHWLLIVPAFGGIILSLAYQACPYQGLEANPSVRVNYFDAFNVGGLRRILIFIFVMSMLFNGVCKWYGVYLDKVYGYNQMTISFLIILTTLAGTLGQLIGGYITDIFGRLNAALVGIGVLGVFIMALYFHYPLYGIAFVLFIISVGWTIAHNGVSTLLTDFPDTYRAELAALNSSVRFLSGGIGFLLSGNFMQQNFGLTFLSIGFIFCMTLFIIPQMMVGYRTNKVNLAENQVV